MEATKLTKEQAWARIDELEAENEELEYQISDNESEIYRLRREFPDKPVGVDDEPELPRVYKGRRGEETWHTDGFAAIRGDWPEPFEEAAGDPDMSGIVGLAETQTEHSVIAEVADDREGDAAYGVLATGVVFDRRRLAPLIEGREVTLCPNGKHPIAIRDAKTGDMFAVLMPVSAHALLNRRPWVAG